MFRSPWILNNTYHVLHHLHHPVAVSGWSGRFGQEVSGLQGHLQHGQWDEGGRLHRGDHSKSSGCEYLVSIKWKKFPIISQNGAATDLYSCKIFLIFEVWDQNSDNLLGHSCGEQLAAGGAGKDPAGLGRLSGGGLPPGAAVDFYDPGPVPDVNGQLAHLRPQADAGRDLLVGPVIIV